MNLEPVLRFDRKPVLYSLILLALILILVWLFLGPQPLDISQFRIIGNYTMGIIPLP